MSGRGAEAEPAADSPRVRRADPTLEARGEESPQDSARRFGLPRRPTRLLYAAFWVVLILPWIRRQRRGPSWNPIRVLVGLAGGGAAALGWTFSTTWPVVLGALLFAAALFVVPAKDPDRERRRQVQHGAQSFLNGGVFAGGRLPGDASVDEGAALYLLVRDAELLLVPQDADDEVSAVIDLRQVAKVLVDGEPYRPVCIPEAKDPPVREEQVDRSRSSTMELVFEDERSVGFRYRGAFSRHLAESTAHAVDQARRSGAVKGSGGPLVSLHTIQNADTEPRAQATGPGHNGFE